MDAPVIVHLHGALALSWVVFFFMQTALVRNKGSQLHRQLGQAGLPIAVGILFTGMGTALWATKRDLVTSSMETPAALESFLSLGFKSDQRLLSYQRPQLLPRITPTVCFAVDYRALHPVCLSAARSF